MVVVGRRLAFMWQLKVAVVEMGPRGVLVERKNGVKIKDAAIVVVGWGKEELLGH